LMVHSLAADMGLWAEQVPPLIRAGFRVLRIDLRGHGGSTALPGAYTMDALAHDLVLLLDFLDIKTCHYLGLSIGGMIGQSFAIHYPERLQSLFLCDCQSQSPADAQEFWGPIIANIEAAGSLEHIADATMERWLSATYREAHPNRWRQVRQTVANCSVQGYIGCALAIANFSHTSRLNQVKVRTLVGCGSLDKRNNPSSTKAIANLFPNGHYTEFVGALHVPNIEMPHEFNARLIDWLQSS
jgi:3-oxoadipate enol-lactonase